MKADDFKQKINSLKTNSQKKAFLEQCFKNINCEQINLDIDIGVAGKYVSIDDYYNLLS